jgi:hypothetical protein
LLGKVGDVRVSIFQVYAESGRQEECLKTSAGQIKQMFQ